MHHCAVIVSLYFRIPDRQWSTIDEIQLPEKVNSESGAIESGVYERQEGRPYGPIEPLWRHGPREHHHGSFYCTHISGVQRLRNGNNLSNSIILLLYHHGRLIHECILVTLGPLGIVVEVTADGKEVWRWICPVVSSEGTVSFVRQGTYRPMGARVSLFRYKKRNQISNY